MPLRINSVGAFFNLFLEEKLRNPIPNFYYS